MPGGPDVSQDLDKSQKIGFLTYDTVIYHTSSARWCIRENAETKYLIQSTVTPTNKSFMGRHEIMLFPRKARKVPVSYCDV